MIRISITAAAFEAIAATLRFGSAGFEREPDVKGEARHGLIGPSRESYSDGKRHLAHCDYVA
jgi:hypothetical protein